MPCGTGVFYSKKERNRRTAQSGFKFYGKDCFSVQIWYNEIADYKSEEFTFL